MIKLSPIIDGANTELINEKESSQINKYSIYQSLCFYWGFNILGLRCDMTLLALNIYSANKDSALLWVI